MTVMRGLSVLGLGAAILLAALSVGSWLVERFKPSASGSSVDLGPKVNPNPTWKVNTKERLSACDNRPGLKKIYVTVLDADGEPEGGVKVRFNTEPSKGIAYDHPNVWGKTNERGFLAWTHLGLPTRYMLWMEGDEAPLIEGITTALPNEYCKPPGTPWWRGNRPVNRPGIFSYRIEVQRKREGD